MGLALSRCPNRVSEKEKRHQKTGILIGFWVDKSYVWNIIVARGLSEALG